jgi:hypothetical protein
MSTPKNKTHDGLTPKGRIASKAVQVIRKALGNRGMLGYCSCAGCLSTVIKVVMELETAGLLAKPRGKR